MKFFKTLLSFFFLNFLFLQLQAQNNGVSLGDSNANGSHSLAAGDNSTANGTASVAMGSMALTTGDYAIAMGNNTHAIGTSSFSFGNLTNAGGDFSLAGGVATTANGDFSIALGQNCLTQTGAFGAMAIGNSNHANNPGSIALGQDVRANADNAVAIGQQTTANGNNSFALGGSSTANAFASVAAGFGSFAGGDNSFAMGINNVTHPSAGGAVSTGAGNQTYGGVSFVTGQENFVQSFASAAFGQYSEMAAGTPSVSTVPTDRLFVIGNGTSSSDRSNAFTMLKSGNTGFSVSNPTETVHVKGAVRVEENAPAVPNPKTLYADALPLAYGSFFGNGALDSGYGIASSSRTAAGSYEIVLDNGWVGALAVNVTVRFGGIVGNDITTSHEFDAATKTVTVFFSSNTNGGSDNAFSLIVFGKHLAPTGSGCAESTSATGLADAPNDGLGWTVTTDACCITDIAFNQSSSEVEVDVLGFVGGNPNEVNVNLSFVSPAGGGAAATSTTVISGAPEKTVYVGVYTASNGNTYDVNIKLSYLYDPSAIVADIVEATVVMTAL